MRVFAERHGGGVVRGDHRVLRHPVMTLSFFSLFTILVETTALKSLHSHILLMSIHSVCHKRGIRHEQAILSERSGGCDVGC